MIDKDQNPEEPKMSSDMNLDQLAEMLTAAQENITSLKAQATGLETILNSMAEAVVVADSEGRFTHFNPAAERIYGKGPVEAGPEAWVHEYGLYTADGLAEYPADRMPLFRALRGDPVDSEELFVRQKEHTDGRWISMSARPLLDPEGKVYGGVAVFSDITERKHTEKIRRKNEKWLAELSELSRVIVEAGPNLGRATTAVVEHTAALIGDACILSLIDPERQKLKVVAIAHEEEAAQTMLTGLVGAVEYELDDGLVGGVISSGEPLMIPSLSAEQLNAITQPEFAPYINEYGMQGIIIAPLRVEDHVLGTLSVTRDNQDEPYTQEDQTLLLDIAHRISLAVANAQLMQSAQAELEQRREMEHALRESETQFRTIFASSPLGIKVLDKSGIIVQINKAMQDILGYTADEIEGKRFSEFTHPDDLDAAERYFYNLVSGNTLKYRIEKRYITKDGTIAWSHLSFTGMRDEEDEIQFVLSIVEDVTERKRIEAELSEMKTRLLDSAELERLRLAQELHDGPMQDLHSVNYQIEALRPDVNEKQSSILQGITQTIQNVLVALRATAKELRPPAITDFGLAKAIRSHVEDLEERHPNITIDLALADDHRLLPERVRLALFRIFQQALMNTIRHAKASQVRVRFTVDAEEIILEIEDNGIGFKVPTRWISLVRQGHFGLAGAAERVEALGGTFQVESLPGEGTALRVIIPRLAQFED